MSDITLDKIYTLPPKTQLTTQPEVSLEGVLRDMETWRANKPSPSTAIPDDLWRKIFELAKIYPETKIRAFLGVSPKQYNSKHQQFFSHRSTEEKSASMTSKSQVDLCQVKTSTSAKTVYQPLKIPASNTIVAEFYRADGCIMKIHTTSESFSSLIQAFFEDVKNVAVNVQT